MLARRQLVKFPKFDCLYLPPTKGTLDGRFGKDALCQ